MVIVLETNSSLIKKGNQLHLKLFSGKQFGSGAFGVVFKAEAIGIINHNETTISLLQVVAKLIKPSSDACYV